MLKSLKALVLVNAVLLACALLSVSGSAQRPPLTSPDGVPYLPVNINPTNIPPVVNINPNDAPAKVDVVRLPDFRLPEIRIASTGCSSARNFQTAVGRAIAGPMMVTFLNLSESRQMTLAGAQGATQRVTLANVSPLSTAIYLRAGQQLTFDADIMYSGCQPE